MRLTLTYKEIKELLILDNGSEVFKNINQQLNNDLKKDKSNKINATQNAHKAKTNKSKRLVEDAINILRLEGKKINPSTVAKQAGINYNTASKYYKILFK